MQKEDFIIQSNVRRILVRTNVDYTKMSFGTVRGVVYFRGIFQLTRVYVYSKDDKAHDLKSRDFTIKTLASLEKKIRTLPGVTDVLFQFNNWRKERGLWVQVEKKLNRMESTDESGDAPSL
jgi:hypothetical protein